MGRTFLDNNPRTSTPNYSQNNNVDLASCHDASFRTMFLFVCLDDDIIGSRRCFRTWERNKLRYQNLCTIGMSSFRSMLSRMLGNMRRRTNSSLRHYRWDQTILEQINIFVC